MTHIEDILAFHQLSIEKFGGSPGVRDNGLLESAVARPYQTFGGEELYKTSIEKAAAIGESLIINHPFIDGNKRTGALAIYALLHNGGLICTAADEGFYSFIISISTGEIKFEEIVFWLKSNTKPL